MSEFEFEIPEQAYQRIGRILAEHIASLPREEALRIDEELHGGNLYCSIASDGQNAVLTAAALLDDGPHVLLKLDPARVGIHLVAGEWVYIDA